MLMGSLIMEEKQLDFNRPLISVRRTSESENKTRSFDSVNNNIPPPVYKSDIKSGPVRNPGTVPFQWEHQPGKPKLEKKPELQCFGEPHFVPKLPPGRRIKQETRAGGCNNVEDAKSYNSSWHDGTDNDSESTYLDANETLSRSESFFFNCSNVSGLDGSGLLVEPFGSLSSDRQTQDLMMGRFLPAAKALTSETHLLARGKPPKPEEPVKVIKEKQNKAEGNNPYRFHQQEEDGNNTRSSFGVLNAVPSVKMQVQRAVSVRRMRSKYQDSTQNKETVNEDNKKLKPVAQGSCQSESCNSAKISKNFGELLASDDNRWEPVAEKTLYIDTVHSVDKKVQEEYKEQSLKDCDPLLDQEAILQPKSTEQMDVTRDEDFIEFSGRKVEESPDQDYNQAIVALPESNLVEITTNLESSRIHHRSSYHIVPPPPLPKAPSDSWLKRTLPTIPSKNNSFTWLHSLGTENNHFTKNQANPKWETMVKTSNTQQGFVNFSKETLNPIPEA